MRKIYRHVVPVDDRTHTYHIVGDILHVANGRTMDEVEFWAGWDNQKPFRDVTVQVFGTGQPVPDDAVYVGTAPRTREGLVWHLFEVTEQ